MGSLGIAIDGGRYVRIDSSTGGLYRNVRLSTLTAGQDSAKLDFCSFGRNGPVLRKSVLLKGLSRGGEAPVELRLRVERRGFALWNINAGRPGGGYEDIRVRTGIGPWPLIIPAILLLVFGLWFAFRLPSRIPRSASAESSGISVIAESTLVDPDANKTVSEAGESKVSSSHITVEADSADPDISVLPEKTTVLFNPESAVLTSTTISELKRLAELIPENQRIEIGGHCAILGTERGRERLSIARSAAVADYLSGRIPDSVRVEIRGYGGSRPITRDLELQDINRRVEIIVLGENG